MNQQESIESELLRFKEESRPDASHLPRDVAEILRFVHDNAFEPLLNVKTVKRACSFRNNNVTTRFRTIMGIGLREYIETLRLEAASALLEQTAAEVYLIAMAIGYEHQETFCRAFLRQVGCTPLQHRVRAGESAQDATSREKTKTKYQSN
ncbi:MAG TPA: helix-turn-helix transcriptional regulator [Thermoanaerobaculia bacterium]|nr:helix-turn-helix transcriptional regulator [Thermoanaerobaculia bacterium]